MANRYRVCPKCKYRYEKIKQKCPSCGKARPKKRVRGHAVALQNSYEHFVEVAEAIHGITDESCCVCRKPKPADRRHDREHGHKMGDPAYGKPRGIACSKCNMLMKFTELDAHRAKLIYLYLQRVHDYYTKPEGQLEEGSREG